MGRIGPYEILAEQSPGLYAARGPRKSACMVRLSAARTATEGAVGPVRALEASQLLGRAAAQALAAGSPYWVPVLDSGSSGDRAYSVTPRYPGSLTRYLAFTSLSEKAVWTVVQRVLRGLEEYRTKAGRPHGNLTANNVLLGATRGDWWQTVRLSDPLGENELDLATAWRDELCRVGALVFRMVLQRPPDALEIPSADEPWIEALGPSGPAWRAFCADMLDRTHPMELADALDRLSRLAPRTPARHRLGRLLILLAPLLVVLAAGGWALVNYQTLPPAIRDPAIRLRCLAGVQSYDPDAWRRLCDEYQVWLGGFAQKAAAERSTAGWREHPYLEKLLGLLEEARGTYDPVRIGGETMAYSDLRSSVPGKARECGSYDLVLSGLDHVAAVRGYLGRATAEHGGWDALRYVTGALSERCAEGRWSATAGYLRGLAAALPPPPESAQREPPGPYAGTDAIAAVLEWWNSLGLAALGLDERIRRIAASGDPFLKRFDAAVIGELAKGAARSRGAPEDIDQLRGYVDEASKLAEAVEALIGKEWAALPRQRQQLWEAEATRRFATTPAPDLDTVRLWLSELRQFSTDPSRDWVLEARELAAITSSDALNAYWRQRRDELLGGPDETGAPAHARSDELRGRIQRLRYSLSSLDDQSILPLAMAGSAEPAVRAKREDVLRRILGLRTDGETDVSALKSSAGVQELCATYRRWRHELPLLAEGLAAVRGQVANLYGYGETGGEDRRPIRGTHETWSGREVWNAPGLPAEMAETCRWLDGLGTVESKQPLANPADRQALRDLALSPQNGLPLVLAAWRRLGAADWPKGDDERRDEELIRNAIDGRMAEWPLPSPERRAVIEWELKTETERRSVRDILEKLGGDPDPALKRFVAFYRQTYADVRQAIGNQAALSELAATSSLARGLARIVMKPEWPEDYDRASLAKGLPAPETFSETFYGSWPDRAEGFRLLKPDPRGAAAEWEGAIARLRTGQEVLEHFPAEKEAAVAGLGEIMRQRDDLLATPAIRANRETIAALRRRLEDGMQAYAAAFAPIAPGRVLSATQWDDRLRQLSRDIEDLARGSPELRALHGELGGVVRRLLGTAPIARNAEAIAALLAGIAKLEHQIQDGTDPTVWLNRVMAQETVSADALASAVWRRLRDDLLQGISADVLKTDRDRYRGLRDQLGAMVEFLGGRQWDTVLPATLPDLPTGLPVLAWHQDVEPALVRQRQDAMEAAARRCHDSPAEAEAILAAYVGTCRTLALARDQLAAVDLRLSQWALPLEPLDATGAPTLGECLRAWSNREELAVARQRLPRLETFCSELFSVATDLERLLSASSADPVTRALPALLQATEAESVGTTSPGTGLSHQYAAILQLHAGYVRLGQIGWPRNLQEMALDLTCSDRLLARLPAERQEALASQIRAARQERWGKGYERLTDCPDLVQGAPALLPRLDLDARRALDTYTGMALGARVNLTAAWLVGQLSGRVGVEGALAARDEAVQMLTALGRQVKYPDPMFTTIEERVRALSALAGREADAAVRGLERSGPGRIGWVGTLNAERTKAVYTTTYGGTPYVLTFLRVRADAENAGRAAFVCTTELPVGLFVAACAHVVGPGGHALGERLLPFLAEELRSAEQDPRRGPRTWQMQRTAEQTRAEAPPRQWLTETPEFTADDQYPAGGTPGAPTPDLPVQYIPPRAAVFVCLALGCRLPTAFEWQQLGKEYPGDTRPPNLRDELWFRQYEHVRQLVPRRRPGLVGLLGVKPTRPWPSADAFPVDSLSEEEDSGHISGNDGYLWFRDIPGGGRTPVDTPIDLTGNVREFVFEDSAQLDRLLDIRDVTREDLRTALTIPRKFAVIGDSALSRPPASGLDAAPLTVPPGVNGWDRGFADVGIRLAFTAPDEDVLGRLKAIADTLCIAPQTEARVNP